MAHKKKLTLSLAGASALGLTVAAVATPQAFADDTNAAVLDNLQLATAKTPATGVEGSSSFTEGDATVVTESALTELRSAVDDSSSGEAPVLSTSDAKPLAEESVTEVKLVDEHTWTASLRSDLNTTQAHLTIASLNDLLAAHAATDVRVELSMKYKGVVTRKVVVQERLDSLKDTDNTLSFDAENFGEFDSEIFFLRDGVIVHQSSLGKLAVIAERYNIAMLPASLPVVMHSVGLWGEDSSRKEAPTIVLLERSLQYDWNNLPRSEGDLYGVYGLPFVPSAGLAHATGTLSVDLNVFTERNKVMRDYVAVLNRITPNAKFHFFLGDSRSYLLPELAYENHLDDSAFKTTYYSDGSKTYVDFKRTFNGKDPQLQLEELKKLWQEERTKRLNGASHAYSGRLAELSDVAFWGHLFTDPNAELIVTRKKLLESSGDNNAWATAIRDLPFIKQISIGAALKNNIQNNPDAYNGFKSLYNMNNSYFEAAYEAGKPALAYLGTHINNEVDFMDYGRLLRAYYGDAFVYYYKGHPATPTPFYESKQKQLSDLGWYDLDATIPAELYLFFNKDLNIAGYRSSTFSSSLQGMSRMVFDYSKQEATQAAASEYSDLDAWVCPASRHSDERIKAHASSGSKIYAIDLSEKEKLKHHADYAIWDADKGVLTFYSFASGSLDSVHEEQSHAAPAQGDYIIKNMAGAQPSLDVVRSSFAEDANVLAWSRHGSENQIWTLSKLEDDTYTLCSRNSGKVLGVKGTVGQGANVVQQTFRNNASQKWKLVSFKDGSFSLLNVADERYALDVAGGYGRIGDNVQLWLAHYGAAQRFSFDKVPSLLKGSDGVAVEDGVYTLVSVVNPELALDIAGASRTNGAPAIVWSASQAENQQFKFERLDNGFYHITSVKSGLALDLANSGKENGTAILQWTSNKNQKNQQWLLLEGPNGSYILRNRASDLVLDISGGNFNAGDRVFGWQNHGGLNQSWYLKKFNDPSITAAALLAEHPEGPAVGRYLINALADKAFNVDMPWGAKTEGLVATLFRNNASHAQTWSLTRSDDGFVVLTNLASGMKLAADQTLGYSALAIQTRDSRASSKWIAWDMGDSHYMLLNAWNPEYALSFVDSPRNGARLSLTRATGAKNQIFSFIEVARRV